MTLSPKYHEPLGIVQRLVVRTLYTDGSYDNGVGGWAVVENGECVLYDWGRGVTSNMAEGHALLEAFRIVGSDSAVVISDSKSWVSSLINKRPIRGKGSSDLYSEAMSLLHPGIRLHWVPSHTGTIEGNEVADTYAREARTHKTSYRGLLSNTVVY